MATFIKFFTKTYLLFTYFEKRKNGHLPNINKLKSHQLG